MVPKKKMRARKGEFVAPLAVSRDGEVVLRVRGVGNEKKMMFQVDLLFGHGQRPLFTTVGYYGPDTPVACILLKALEEAERHAIKAGRRSKAELAELAKLADARKAKKATVVSQVKKRGIAVGRKSSTYKWGDDRILHH